MGPVLLQYCIVYLEAKEIQRRTTDLCAHTRFLQGRCNSPPMCGQYERNLGVWYPRITLILNTIWPQAVPKRSSPYATLSCLAHRPCHRAAFAILFGFFYGN